MTILADLKLNEYVDFHMGFVVALEAQETPEQIASRVLDQDIPWNLTSDTETALTRALISYSRVKGLAARQNVEIPEVTPQLENESDAAYTTHLLELTADALREILPENFQESRYTNFRGYSSEPQLTPVKISGLHLAELEDLASNSWARVAKLGQSSQIGPDQAGE